MMCWLQEPSFAASSYSEASWSNKELSTFQRPAASMTDDLNPLLTTTGDAEVFPSVSDGLLSVGSFVADCGSG